MKELRFEIKDKRLLESIGRAPGVLKKHLKPAISRSILEMARGARRNAPKAQSVLTNSILTRMSLDGLEGIARPTANYGQAVEEGTGRYGPSGQASGKLPPVDAIQDWIDVKNIEPDDPTMTQEDLAYLIARSIAMRGTPAQPYLYPSFRQHKAAAARRIDGAIAAAIREVQR